MGKCSKHSKRLPVGLISREPLRVCLPEDRQHSGICCQLVGVAWGPTLQFFDFPAKPEGFQEVFQGISKHGWNIHVKTEAHAIERLLRVPLGSTFFIPGDGDDAEQYPSSPGLVEEPSATGDFSGATAKPQ